MSRLVYTILLIIVLIFCNMPAHAQSYKWLRGGGTSQSLTTETSEAVYFMCTDPHGNVYSLSVVGTYAIIADTFYRPTGAFGSPKNVLFTSHNCNGQMRFAKLISCNATIPYGVVSDNSAHIYLALDLPHFSTSSATTLRIGYDTTITTYGNNRIGLIKYDTIGQLDWVRFAGENLPTTFNGMGGPYNHLTLDGANNPHVIAATKYGVNLTPTLVSHTGFYDHIYDPSGNLLSVKHLEIDSSLIIYGATIDRQSNKLYAYGMRNYSAFPDSSRFPFIASFDIARNRIWMDTVANPYYANGGFTSITSDGIGHLYGTVGSAKGFIYRGDTALNVVGSGPASVTSIVKMDTAGYPIWMRVFSSTISSGIGYATMMPNNKIAACGSIAGGKIVSGTDTITVFPSEGQNAIFTIVDSAGYIQTLQQMHGVGFYDRSGVCVSDKVGNLYIGGKVDNNIWAGSLTPYTSVGGDSDYFIMKYGVDCSCTSMPVANYTYTGTGLTRSFTYTGTATGIDSVKWTFGDGGTSTSMTPTHTYTGPGTFTTCVRAYSACGNDMRCYEVTVSCSTTPISAFTDTGNIVRGFTYSGTTAGLDSVTWDFGDGNTGAGLSTIHTYAVADTYHVCATVHTNCGSHTFCKEIIVLAPGSVSALSYSNANMRAYPNPVTNEFYVTGVSQKTAYRMLNAVGAVKQAGILNTGFNTIHAQQLPAGMYLLEMTGMDGSKKILRIVKE